MDTCKELMDKGINTGATLKKYFKNSYFCVFPKLTKDKKNAHFT